MRDQKDEERPPTDQRGFRARSERRTLLTAIFLLLVVGGLLIGLIFGWREMLGALPCLVAGVFLMVGLYAFWSVVERWVNR